MDLRQLRCLVAVIDEGSFSAAGRRLGISQPAVSLQIQRLERELDDLVLLRDGRQISLTATGEALLPHARRALRALDEAEVAVSLSRGIVSGSVRFGTVPGCGGVGLPGLLRVFRETYPRVFMRVLESTADDLIRQVTTGQIDIAIVGTPSPSTHGLMSQVIMESAMVAVVGIDHELASMRSISLGTLLEHDIMSTPRRSGIRAALDVARKSLGLDMSVRYESGNPDMLVQFATAGLGVAIVPDDASLHDREDIAVLEITDPAVSGCLELVWSGQGAASPAVRELVRLAEMLKVTPAMA